MRKKHNLEIKKYWDEQGEILKKIKEKGGMANYIKTIPNIQAAFKGNDLIVCCIDEGTAYGCIRFAGSLILNQGKVETYVEILKNIGVKGIYSHAGCGAAELFAKQNNLDIAKADEYGIDWAKKLADMFGVPYKGHISAKGFEPMKRPKEFHIARVIYYDGTGRFNPDKIKDLPLGFVISRRYHLEIKDALNEVKIAISIATGSHGFGDLIDKDHPIMIISMGDRGDQNFSVEKMKNELDEIAKEFKDKVMVDGFEI